MPINLLLKCLDIERTKKFYLEVLGFEVRDTVLETCSVYKDDCTILFTADNLWLGDPRCTGTAYLLINDVDAFYSEIQSRVEILWPLQNMSYGLREFGIRDCNGYHLAFAQAV